MQGFTRLGLQPVTEGIKDCGQSLLGEAGECGVMDGRRE